MFYTQSIYLSRHHRLLCDVLQHLADGMLLDQDGKPIRRVMFFLPPGSAKSTYASVCFPTWMMGRKKAQNIITLSYGSDLARKFGRRCRSIVRSQTYYDIFEKTLDAEVAAANEWNLDDGSTYMANGMIAGVTGNRADGLIIDDPVRGIKDADSEAFQKSTYEAYIFDARTRLKGANAWQLLIQTRWSVGDLAGQLLPENYDFRSGPVLCRDGHVWFVVNVPYEAEHADDPLGRKPGELLWTEEGSTLNPEDLLKTKHSSDPVQMRTWASLYQQRPTLGEGLIFKRSWFKTYNELPTALHYYLTSDFALTKGGGDYTVHSLWGVDPDFNLYLIYVYRQQVTSDVSVEFALEMIKEWEVLVWGAERDQIVNSIGPFIRRMMNDRRIYCPIEELPLGRQGDKVMRSRAFQSYASMGKVYIPERADWIDDWMTEVLRFGGGAKHDDQVDSAGVMGRLLDILAAGYEAPPPDAPNNRRDYPGPEDDDGETWRTR